MALPSVGEERETNPERLNSLRNFTLPPVKWASQRRTNAAAGLTTWIPLGCDRRSPAPESIRNREPEPEKNNVANARSSKKKKKQTTVATLPRTDGGDGECGIEEMRKKLVIDLKVSIDRMKDAIIKNEKQDKRLETPAPPHTAETEEGVKRWNLRTRRGDCDKAKGLETEPNCSFPERRNKSRSNTERVKFCLELSKKEIEEDFMAMVGHLPPRKPKRPKAVKKQLDVSCICLFITSSSSCFIKTSSSSSILVTQQCT